VHAWVGPKSINQCYICSNEIYREFMPAIHLENCDYMNSWSYSNWLGIAEPLTREPGAHEVPHVAVLAGDWQVG
jgi:hypothetical protein